MLLRGHSHILGALPCRECSRLQLCPRGMRGASGSHAGELAGIWLFEAVAVKLASLTHSDPDGSQGSSWRAKASALVAEVSQIKLSSLSRIPLQHCQLLQALVWSRLDFSFWLRGERAVLSPPPTSKGLSQRKPWICHILLRVGHRLLSAAEVKDNPSWLSAPS